MTAYYSGESSIFLKKFYELITGERGKERKRNLFKSTLSIHCILIEMVPFFPRVVMFAL